MVLESKYQSRILVLDDQPLDFYEDLITQVKH